MKFQLCILLALFAVAFAAPNNEEQEWAAYKGKHGKKYRDQAHQDVSKKNWKTAKLKIEKHNKEAAAGTHPFTMAVNHLADKTAEEIKALKNEKDEAIGKTSATLPTLRAELMDRQSVPASLDWSASSCMTPPKDQGQCGDCYAFAAVGVLEFVNCAKKNQLVLMSEQNLNDCSTAYGNAKCDGGLALQAWNYVQANGINTQASYPYTASAGTCRYNASANVVSLAGWGYATQSWNESSIATALATYGPVAVSIDASNIDYYSSGVFVDTACSQTSTNHAVVAVGYGHDAASNLDYWIIRNSWGTSWGLNGYMKFKRGTNQCAIAKRPVYVVLN